MQYVIVADEAGGTTVGHAAPYLRRRVNIIKYYLNRKANVMVRNISHIIATIASGKAWFFLN